MKKQVLLLFAALVFCQAAFAYNFYAVAPSGQTLYYTINSDGIVSVVAPGTGSNPWNNNTKPTGNLIIPDSVTYSDTVYLVASIGLNAFRSCTGLTSVTIPNSVTSIGLNAFNGCTGLTSVTIGNSVTSIASEAFFGCTGLTSMAIPNSVVSIGSKAFSLCSGLTSVTIPTSVISIGSEAFSHCSGLTSVTIPNSVTSIYDGTFRNCSGLTSVIIPNSVTSIGEYAFSVCAGLTSVTIPNSVVSIGNNAFDNCSGLTSIFVEGGNIVYDSRENCNAIIESSSNTLIAGCMNTIIPNSVTSIGQEAFIGCSGLTSVTIPNSVTSIRGGAFLGCRGLTSVTIPNAVISIGEFAFGSCTGLTAVVFNAESCTSGGNLFSNCSNITSFTFGSNVRGIPDNLCYGMNRLTSIRFLSQMPPQPGTDAFTGVPTDIPVYIPCGRLAYYVAQMPQFSNYVETMVSFSAISDDESTGTVQVLTMPSCTDHNAVLYAVPADGYRFDHWSTGSTTNPYTLTVTNDTTIIGYFVSDGTQGIDDLEVMGYRLRVMDGRIHVTGAEEFRVYDMMGREVFHATHADETSALPVGVYLVKIGTLPAQKVVVMR